MRDFEPAHEIAALDGVVQEFTLRGVEFKAKPYVDHKDVGAVSAIGASSIAAGEDVSSVVSRAIRNTLLPEYRDVWDNLMQQEFDVPIRLQTLDNIFTFLIEGATGRPTGPSSPSGATANNSPTRSTDDSASPAAPASPPSPSVRA